MANAVIKCAFTVGTPYSSLPFYRSSVTNRTDGRL